MANPQKENGYTPIANELLEKIISSKLTYAQESIVFAIIRYTYGFNKKSAELPTSFLARATGNKERNISYALKKLIQNHIVISKSKNSTSTKILSLNKNYDEWITTTATQCICNTVHNTTATQCITLLQHSADNKENYKENYKEILSSKFQLFYSAYPKKQKRAEAEKAFLKLKPSDELFNTMLMALENQKQCEDWKRESGRFIPLPSSWLNGKRWEDETSCQSNKGKRVESGLTTEQLKHIEELRKQ